MRTYLILMVSLALSLAACASNGGTSGASTDDRGRSGGSTDSSGYDATGLPPSGPVCQENCVGRACGPDRCGGSCGTCEGEDLCLDGKCYLTENNVCDELGDDLDLDDGYCDGMTAVWCEEDGLHTQSCGEYTDATGEKWKCGFKEDSGKWGCGSNVCVPNCTNKECGDDGCGGHCGMGCSPGLACYDGACCEPQCEGKECGDDGCGGKCGMCEGLLQGSMLCGEEDLCVCEFFPCGEMCCASEEHTCVNDFFCCLPNCKDKECGQDGCGGFCDCPEGLHCNEFSSECVCNYCMGSDDNWCCLMPGQVCCDGECCTADCTGKECGNDECCGSCGTCDFGVCLQGTCCVPDCEGKECGSDSCGGTCNVCDYGECVDSACLCEPDCEGKECGDDGCGGVCGECVGGLECVNGICENVLNDSCFGHCDESSPDGCWCDETCNQYDDCCADICSACGYACPPG